MFDKIVKTIIGGAIGAAALYVVGHLAYQAGQDVAREECRYNAMRKANSKVAHSSEKKVETKEELIAVPEVPTEIHIEKKKQGKLGLILGARKLFGNKKSIIGGLVQEPEAHKFEAFVEGDELQIHVKRRDAS